MGNFVIIFGDPAFFCSCTLSLLANGYYAALNCHAGWSNHIEDTFFIKAVSNPNEMSKRVMFFSLCRFFAFLFLSFFFLPANFPIRLTIIWRKQSAVKRLAYLRLSEFYPDRNGAIKVKENVPPGSPFRQWSCITIYKRM